MNSSTSLCLVLAVAFAVVASRASPVADTCANAPCAAGVCTDLADGTHTCACPVELGGDSCELANPCMTNNGGCQNLAACVFDSPYWVSYCQCAGMENATTSGQYCDVCADGWSDDGLSLPVLTCSVLVDHCPTFHACDNGGVCKSAPPGYAYCECPDGTTADNCDPIVGQATSHIVKAMTKLNANKVAKASKPAPETIAKQLFLRKTAPAKANVLAKQMLKR